MADSEKKAQAENVQRSTRKLPPRVRKPLPCGAMTCLHCHAQCGAVMSSYILDGLDTPPVDPAE